jgi:hypothetical protein
MAPLPPPLAFFLLLFSGWVNRHQQALIDYLLDENRVLRAAHGPRRLCLTDDQRRRLALKGKVLGRRRLANIVGIVTPDTILGCVSDHAPMSCELRFHGESCGWEALIRERGRAIPRLRRVRDEGGGGPFGGRDAKSTKTKRTPSVHDKWHLTSTVLCRASYVVQVKNSLDRRSGRFTDAQDTQP